MEHNRASRPSTYIAGAIELLKDMATRPYIGYVFKGIWQGASEDPPILPANLLTISKKFWEAVAEKELWEEMLSYASLTARPEDRLVPFDWAETFIFMRWAYSGFLAVYTARYRWVESIRRGKLASLWKSQAPTESMYVGAFYVPADDIPSVFATLLSVLLGSSTSGEVTSTAEALPPEYKRWADILEMLPAVVPEEIRAYQVQADLTEITSMEQLYAMAYYPTAHRFWKQVVPDIP